MKTLYFSILMLFGSALYSQSYTDCAGNSEDLMAVLATGKPVLIASKGFDCSICVSQAPSIGQWASNNPQVRVWGAMTFAFNAGATPNCNQTNTWISTHGWQDVFTFIDASRDYFMSGTPRYYVYDPVSGQEIYDGFSFTQASQAALGVASGVGLEEANQASVAVGEDYILLSNINRPMDWRLMDLTGKILSNGNVIPSVGSFQISSLDLRSGIYLLMLDGIAHKLILP
jgi:hypothetical protein